MRIILPLIIFASIIVQSSSYAQQKLLKPAQFGVANNAQFSNLQQDPTFSAIQQSSIQSYTLSQDNAEIWMSLSELNFDLLSFRGSSVEFQDDFNYQYSGKGEYLGKPSRCFLTMKEGRFYGRVFIDKHMVELTDFGGGRIVACLVDEDFRLSLLAHEEADFVPEDILNDPSYTENPLFSGLIETLEAQVQEESLDKPRPETNKIEEKSFRNCKIDVLVAHSPLVSSTFENYDLVIANLIQELNEIWVDSGINYQRDRLNCVGVEEIQGIDENALIEQPYNIDIFENAALGETVINDEQLQNYKAEYNADIVLFLTRFPFGGYEGYMNVRPDSPHERYVATSTFLYNKFQYGSAHSVGRLLGCGMQYGYGDFNHASCVEYRKDGATVREGTIMARIPEMSAEYCATIRMPYYSTPEIAVGDDTPFYDPIPIGDYGYSNNVRHIKRNVCRLASLVENPQLLSIWTDIEPFQCPGGTFNACATVEGGSAGNFDFDWSYSHDGITWQNLQGVAECCNIPLGFDVQTRTYIKLKCTDTSGQVAEVCHSVETAYTYPNQQYPCTLNAQEETENEAIPSLSADAGQKNQISKDDKFGYSNYIVDLSGKVVISFIGDFTDEIQEEYKQLPIGVYIHKTVDQNGLLISQQKSMQTH